MSTYDKPGLHPCDDCDRGLKGSDAKVLCSKCIAEHTTPGVTKNKPHNNKRFPIRY